MIKTIGILGGMGPNATLYFYQKILSLTPAQIDQDHIPTLIFSNPRIPDRTQSILSNEPETSLHFLKKSARILEEGGVSFIAIPCNTAHYWIQEIRRAVRVPVIDMIDITIKYIIDDLQLEKVGLLSTIGTIKTQIYQKRISHQSGLQFLVPNESLSRQVMDVIHEIKKGNRSEQLVKKIEQVREWFGEQGVSRLILGCTELPLLFEKKGDWMIDPLDILAKQSVQMARKAEKLMPLPLPET